MKLFKDKVKMTRMTGVLSGLLLTIMIVVFTMMYTSFVSLFSTLDVTHIYRYQLVQIRNIGWHIVIIKGCFFVSFMSMIIHTIVNILLLKESQSKNKWPLVLGVITLVCLVLALPFMVTLNNLQSFSKDLDLLKPQFLKEKYDYIMTMINSYAGFSSIISRGMMLFVSGGCGVGLLVYYLVEILLDKHLVILEESSPIKSSRRYVLRKPVAIVLGIIIGISCAYTGYSFYQTNYHYTKVDLMSPITFDYKGESGQAVISHFKSNVQLSSQYQEFLNSVKYDYKEKKNLSNGQTFTITATYSQDIANKLKVKVSKYKKTYKVSGLVYRFDSASDISREIKSSIKSQSNEVFDRYFKTLSSNTEGYSYELENIYFGKNAFGSQAGDYVFGVYKVTYSYKTFFIIPRTTSYYLYTYCHPVNSNYLNTISSQHYQVNKEKINTTSQDAIEGLKSLYPSLNIEKIKY